MLYHKTASTSGPAVMAFSGDLYHECNVYIQKIRNNLDGIGKTDDDPVFISWSGRQMSSSLIGDQFNAFFQRATNKSLLERKQRKITTTLVRKSFVSNVHADHPDLKRDLSNMMNHSEETARNTYFLEEKTKNVAKTFSKMQRNMRNQAISVCPDEELKKIFAVELESPEMITLDTVKYKADEIINIPFTNIQIRDKLRYMQKQGQYVTTATTQITNEKNPPETEVMSDVLDDEIIATSDCLSDDDSMFSSCSTRMVYSPAKESLIKAHCPAPDPNKIKLYESE